MKASPQQLLVCLIITSYTLLEAIWGTWLIEAEIVNNGRHVNFNWLFLAVYLILNCYDLHPGFNKTSRIVLRFNTLGWLLILTSVQWTRGLL